MPAKKKKFRLFDAVLASVCIILTVESAAPAAAVGNSQYFWWISMLILFFVPYGLISAELGTTYLGEGGIYDWVRLAYGNKWGCRIAWNYWINVALWIASLAVLFNDTLTQITGWDLPVWASIAIQLAFIWVVILMGKGKISESKWLINTAAVFKVFIMLLIGGLGIWVAATRGMATQFTFRSLFPSMDLSSLSFVSIIIYNFVGFEIVTTLASDMEKPKKQIPQALLLGGIIISLFYMFASFGIGVAIPVSELSTSTGLLDSLIYLAGDGTLVLIVGLMVMFTFFANLVSWAYGSLYVAKYAAENYDMPRVFASANSEGVPDKSPILNGIIASVLVVVAPFLPNQDVFWSFFSVGVFTLMVSYVPMFPAFLKLRRIDPDRERPFKVGGKGLFLKLMAYVPMALIVVSLIFTVVPMNTSPEELNTKIPLCVGILVSVVIQEILVAQGAKRRAGEAK
ncbi:amino acid permease [Allofournierella sp.]|uniref:APC family permease n=1 Tax=Allofournierella sp. TaxID=1940256 RepID=UPI0015AF5555